MRSSAADDDRLLQLIRRRTARTRWLPTWAHRWFCLPFGFVWSVGTFFGAVERGWRVCCRCGHAERES
jgi:hypothetical protein